VHQLTPSHSFSEIVGYLERQYDGILAEESRIKRNPRFRDDRVHVLLYFITPTGHGYVVLSTYQGEANLPKVSANSISNS
jgi:septin family protein